MKLAKTSKNEGSLLNFSGARSAPEKSSDPGFSGKTLISKPKKSVEVPHSETWRRSARLGPMRALSWWNGHWVRRAAHRAGPCLRKTH